MSLDGRNDVRADRKHPRLLMSDPAFLVGNQWLSLEVMQFFISLINGIRKDTHISSLVELRDLGSGGKLEELKLGWKKYNVTSICVIANMGKDKLDETFLASTTRTGNYWACFLINLTSQNVIYCDSLAWNAPRDLISNLDFLINPVRKIFPYTSEYVFIIDTINKGSKNNILTFQGSNQDICVVACLPSVILVTHPTVKHLLISKGKLPDHLLWMARIFNYSDFLQCVMIKWYVEQTISPGDIGMEPKVSYIYVIILYM